jgi:hypothetical protein
MDSPIEAPDPVEPLLGVECRPVTVHRAVDLGK